MNDEFWKKRDSSLDIIRIFAFMSVVSVHFFLNSEFYYAPVSGIRMYIMILVRTFFMICVPMFLILSGYLCNKKTPSKKYFYGIIKVLSTYVLAGLCCLVVKSQIEDLNILNWIIQIFNFTSAPYAWYIEMYIGLFLLIPFLNQMYHGLKSKKEKQGLLLVLIFLTILPVFINAKMQSIPNWWMEFYPVTYYMVGAYLSEYFPKTKTRNLIFLLLAHILLSGTYIYFRSYGQYFVNGFWNNWKSITNFITAILVFMILKRIDTTTWNVKIKKGIQAISSVTLGAYLVSWIFDTIFYPTLNAKISSIPVRFNYFIPMVLLISASSLCLSAILNQMNKVILKISDKYLKPKI